MTNVLKRLLFFRSSRPPDVVVPALMDGANLPSVRKLHRAARVRGRRAGRAAAFGNPHADRIHELPGRTWIEKSVHARLSEIRRVVHQRGIDIRHNIQSLGARAGAETARLHEAKEDLERTDAEIEALPPNRSPGWITYGVVLLLLASAEYPTLKSALATFPGDSFTRNALAIVLNGVLAVAAHYLAKSVRAVVDEGQHRERGDRRFEMRLVTIQVVIFFVAIVGLMAFMGLTRGESFAKQAGLTGGLIGNPDLLAGLMLTLQLLLFVIAVVVGLLHAEGDRARHLKRERRRLERGMRKAERREAALSAHRVMLQEELEHLSETETLWVDREQHLLGELLATHDHAYESTEHSLFTRFLGQRLGMRRA